MTAALVFDDVSVRFGSRRAPLLAVDGVSLEVPASTVVGLVGESGCGKSTLARCAVGLVPLAGGRITLGGEPVTTGHGRRRVQMVFQDPYSSLNPRMTIGESISEALPGRTRRSTAKQDVARLLGLVDIDPDRASGLPANLSGGQRQRVALARALAADPQVLIADEITSSLDVSVQGSVLNLVRKVLRELGLAVLFISHNLAVVRYVSDAIAVMRGGKLVEVGLATRVLTSPEHAYTQSLLDAVPRLRSPLAAPDDSVRAEQP